MSDQWTRAEWDAWHNPPCTQEEHDFFILPIDDTHAAGYIPARTTVYAGYWPGVNPDDQMEPVPLSERLPGLRVQLDVLPWQWRLRPRFHLDDVYRWHRRGHVSVSWLFLTVEVFP